MSHREFNDLLNSLKGLSPQQLATLRHEVDCNLASSRPARAKQAGEHDEETVFDVMERAGLIGCLQGGPGTPTDLATNPKHMEGFGNA